MASKFWAHESGASGSESDSDSDSDSSMDGGGGAAGARRQWAVDSDSESEEEVRVVKSAKDRSFEAIRTSVGKIRTKIKINDWNGIQANFDECNKHVDKSKVMIAKEGVPNFYIKLLANLEDLLATTLKDKAAIRKMSGTNTRSLNRMKLQLRKHNKGYEKEIADFRANPAAYAEESSSEESDSSDDSSSDEDDSSSSEEEDSDSEDGSDDDSDEAAGDSDEDSDDSEDGGGATSRAVGAAKASKPIKTQKNLEDMDSDDWSSDSDSDSDSDGSEDESDMLKGRAKWLKKTDDTADVKKRKDEKRAAKVEDGKKKKDKAVVVAGKDKGPALKLDLDITSEELEKRLRECLASRGRKATDPKDVLRQLSVLAYVARRLGPIREIPIIMYLVSSMFDTLRNIDELMETSMWKSCREYINRVTDLLEARPELTLGQMGNEVVADLLQAGTGVEVDESEVADVVAEVEKTGVLKVVGSLSLYMIRLGDEYTKSLQSINPHTQEYIRRLKDESVVVELAGKVQGYYERQGEMGIAADLALLQAEHLYYQHESIARAVHKAQSFTNKFGKTEDLHPACTVASASAPSDGALDVTKGHPAAFLGQPAVEHEYADYTAQLKRLCVTVYQHGDDRCRTRAMLCHITHHALHDRFYPARDLLLMSHLQDNISQADISTQILYNRMMVTLGLCAFRKGLIHEAHDCLRDVCSSRVKELLAQGVQMNRFQDKNPEQEKAERRRQTPYHMHINLDLLECCHLTSAMLLEVPNMAQESTELRRRVMSKHFRRYVDIFNRQVFTGPPENIRDHVIAAAKRLMEGDWKRCSDLILGLDVWNLIPGEGSAEIVKAMVKEKIQAEALRTYLFTYSPYYESLSLPTLCEMFDMEKSKAHSIISKMMLNQELYGSWDQPTETVVLRKEDPNTLQLLALKFADKAANLVESNERLIDARTGAYGYRDDGGRGGGGRGGGGRDGGRGTGDWGGGRGYNRPGQTANNRYQGGRGGGRGGYGGRGAGNYIRERRDMGVGPRR